jgi:branched-chain amino acid transport system ATP-binding protein
MSEPILDVRGLTRRFGGLVAVDNVSFDIEAGEIRGIIGPNGAGKTTCFNLLTGFLTPSSGSLSFMGRSVVGKKPYEVARLGMVRTFQHTTVFPTLLVEENLLFGRYLHDRRTPLGAFFWTKSYRQSSRQSMAQVERVLDLMDMSTRRHHRAGDLSYGELRYLEIALALMAEPKLLLLDEPAAGLNPQESERLMQIILRLRASGVTVVLIEHNMNLVMSCCDRIVVLSFGKVLADGTADQIQADKNVVEVYLGGGISPQHP